MKLSFGPNKDPYVHSVFVVEVTDVAMGLIRRGEDVNNVEVRMTREAMEYLQPVLPALWKITKIQHALITISWSEEPLELTKEFEENNLYGSRREFMSLTAKSYDGRQLAQVVKYLNPFQLELIRQQTAERFNISLDAEGGPDADRGLPTPPRS